MKAVALALDHLLRAVGDPVADLRGIGASHAGYIEALVLRAAAGVLAKSPEALPAIAQALREADGRAASPQARAHFAAAAAWLGGDPVAAAEGYASILGSRPHDVLALRLAQSCCFFLGWHDRFCAVVDAVAPAWSPAQPGFGFLLAMASFAHAENGDAARAEALGRKALAGDPSCPLGVHAVAHAIAESGRHRSGAQWMRDQAAQWAISSRMRTHNAWHLAMFNVDEGDAGSALRILDAWLLPASANSAIEACDVVDLLWRLDREGADNAGRWKRVSDTFARAATPGYWPYVDLHAGLAHLAAGQHARARQLARAIDRAARGGDHAGLRARRVTRPGLQALAAWAAGRHGEAAVLLAGLRSRLGEAGGSRIQLDVFNDIGRLPMCRQRERPRWPERPQTTELAAAD